MAAAPHSRSANTNAGIQAIIWLVLEMAALAALTLLAYSNHFGNSFHFDDSHTIVNNSAIRELRNIPRFFSNATTFSSLPSNQSYRPIVSTVLALDYHLAGGLAPFWFQLSGFVYFLAEVILLGLVIKRLLDAQIPGGKNAGLAVAAAGLYAVHPANADTVNYVIACSDVLSTLGVIASLACAMWLPWTRGSGLFVLPAMLGILAKPPAALFAPLYFLCALLFPTAMTAGPEERPRRGRGAVRMAGVFLACGATVAFVSHMTPRQWTAGAASGANYLLTQPFVALLYFKNFFWANGLSADYDLEPFQSLADPRVWLGFAFVCALLCGALFCVGRPKLRLIGFGLLWFLLALLPTSLLPMAEVMNDHRPFIAYPGLAMAAAGAVQLVLASSREWTVLGAAFAASAAFALYGGSAYATYQRNKDWKDEETLWRDVTVKSPGNGRGLMNYGLTQMAKGEIKAALDYFQRAEQLTPNYPQLMINIAIAKDAAGEPGAEEYFERALALAPELPDSDTYYARWLLDHGRGQEAIPLLRKAIALSPGDLHAQELLARASDPNSPRADGTPEHYLSLSLQHYQERDYAGAIACAESALQLRPDYAEAWNNIGAAHNSLGEYGKAIPALQKALELKPGFALARANLAYAQRMLADSHGQ